MVISDDPRQPPDIGGHHRNPMRKALRDDQRKMLEALRWNEYGESTREKLLLVTTRYMTKQFDVAEGGVL
tara:strand:+ start:147 stop:356 length:210 start_codon:yes stop_codon:yes gene_type:complete